MRASGKKIIVLILGFLVSLAVLEVSLRVVGVVYSHRASDGDRVKRTSGALVILCIGDSFTFGSGAPEGRGYPAQLEELLQNKYPGKKIKVVNKGVGGYNTAMVSGKFDADIDSVNPDVIIILAGGANRFNAYGYGDYLNRNDWMNRLGNWLYNIKIFKLTQLLMFDLQNKKERLLNDYIVAKMPRDAEEWRERGRELEREGKYAEAILWYKKIVENYPSAFGGYDRLRNAYFMTGNKKGERQMFRKLVELDPECLKFIIRLPSSFLADPIYEKEDLQFMQRYEHANPIAGDILKRWMKREKSRRETQAWINHDMDEMIWRAHRRGIKVIVQNYPDYQGGGRGDHSAINEGLRKTAKKNGVLFVDNERLFNRIFLNDEDKDDYFEPQRCHCSEKGYGVMAENIYCGIIASNGLGILPNVDPAEKSRCREFQDGASPV